MFIRYPHSETRGVGSGANIVTGKKEGENGVDDYATQQFDASGGGIVEVLEAEQSRHFRNLLLTFMSPAPRCTGPLRGRGYLG